MRPPSGSLGGNYLLRETSSVPDGKKPSPSPPSIPPAIGLAFPGGKPRPEPGPYRGDGAAERAANGNHRAEPPGPDGSGPEQRSDGVRVSMPGAD
jgi:hypothetical protein